MSRSLAAAAAVAACALALAPAADARGKDGHHDQSRAVDVQLLGLNDLHGHIEQMPYVDTIVDQRTAENPRGTLVVSAGDNVGASPLVSALFHDEPAIESLNLLGTDLSAVGNHEFDEGVAELRRLQRGGCHPGDGCQDGDGFAGADFQYLAANVVETSTGRTLFPPYAIRRVQGARVAFVGLTLESTPSIVAAEGVKGVEFRDEVQTLNALVPQLRRRGADAIVVLLHEGGMQSGGLNACTSFTGPARDIVEQSDDAVDVWLTGHTHAAYNCTIDGDLVTSASSFGRVVTDVDLRIDRRRGVVASRAENVPVTTTVPADAEQTALLDKYRELARPIASQVIGSTARPISRADTKGTGESALGDVIADAQLQATRDAGARIAFMNPGGIRADFDAGEVTYEEAFTVQPFGNSLVTLDLTGAQIERLLEQQWADPQRTRVLQVSEGLRYAYSLARPAGDRVDPASIRLGDEAVDPAATYRVTVNSFLADGGDAFTVLREGGNRVGGEVDLDALVAYFRAHSPVEPGPQDRIAKLG